MWCGSEFQAGVAIINAAMSAGVLALPQTYDNIDNNVIYIFIMLGSMVISAMTAMFLWYLRKQMHKDVDFCKDIPSFYNLARFALNKKEDSVSLKLVSSGMLVISAWGVAMIYMFIIIKNLKSLESVLPQISDYMKVVPPVFALVLSLLVPCLVTLCRPESYIKCSFISLVAFVALFVFSLFIWTKLTPIRVIAAKPLAVKSEDTLAGSVFEATLRASFSLSMHSTVIVNLDTTWQSKTAQSDLPSIWSIVAGVLFFVTAWIPALLEHYSVTGEDTDAFKMVFDATSSISGLCLSYGVPVILLFYYLYNNYWTDNKDNRCYYICHVFSFGIILMCAFLVVYYCSTEVFSWESPIWLKLCIGIGLGVIVFSCIKCHLRNKSKTETQDNESDNVQESDTPVDPRDTKMSRPDLKKGGIIIFIALVIVTGYYISVPILLRDGVLHYSNSSYIQSSMIFDEIELASDGVKDAGWYFVLFIKVLYIFEVSFSLVMFFAFVLNELKDFKIVFDSLKDSLMNCKDYLMNCKDHLMNGGISPQAEYKYVKMKSIRI
jgi:hypothetical protein